jgi:polar amino acid transport system permease protein
VTRERAVRLAVVAAFAAAIAGAVALAPADVRWELAWQRRALFAEGLALTIAISAAALVIGLIAGTAAGLARVSASPALDQAAFTYVELVRGTPFLVQLYVLYFCVGTALRLHDVFGRGEALVVGIVGLGLFAGGYVAEIVRAGVESVDRGQWEAARSLGLSHRHTLFRVILPQSLRRMIPPLTGEAVSLVKESSLLSVIAVAEMTYHARALSSAEADTFAAFLPLAALYLAVTLPLSWLTRRLERRLGPPAPLPVSRL